MSAPRFKPDFSPTVVWPAIFWQTSEDGEQREFKVQMRWNRPTASDAKKYFELQKEALDVRMKALTDFGKQLQTADAEALPTQPTDEALQAKQDAIFNPEAQLAKWWKGWKPDAIEGYDPESEADRAALLEAVGMKDALFAALNSLMQGGRLKNSQMPLGR